MPSKIFLQQSLWLKLRLFNTSVLSIFREGPEDVMGQGHLYGGSGQGAHFPARASPAGVADQPPIAPGAQPHSTSRPCITGARASRAAASFSSSSSSFISCLLSFFPACLSPSSFPPSLFSLLLSFLFLSFIKL